MPRKHVTPREAGNEADSFPISKGIGERLREERERLGLSQDAFAAKVGIHRNTQNNYEKGSRSFDMTYLHAIKGLGVDFVYVLDGIRATTARHYEAIQGLCGALLEVLGYSAGEAVDIENAAIDAVNTYGVGPDSFIDEHEAMREVADNAIHRSRYFKRLHLDGAEHALTDALEAVEQAAQQAGASLTPSKRVQAVMMLYRQAAKTGRVDIDLAKMAVKLAG